MHLEDIPESEDSMSIVEPERHEKKIKMQSIVLNNTTTGTHKVQCGHSTGKSIEDISLSIYMLCLGERTITLTPSG